jgi:hypothetical protein
MSRALTGLAVAAALIPSAVCALAREVPPCRSRSINVEHANYALNSKAVGGSICAQGNPARIHLEFSQATIASVLSALRTAYHISYRSSLALNEIRGGIYAGSLRHVISQLLSDYNYVIKVENGRLDVVIFSKIGEQAIPAPIATEVRENSVRRTAGVSRTH